MMCICRQNSRMSNRCQQHGAAAVEFALIFPVLFLLMYGLLTYALVFATQHSLSLAAAEGARAAVRFQSAADEPQIRLDAACAVAQKSVAWLAKFSGYTAQCAASGILYVDVKTSPQDCPVRIDLSCISVTVSYNYNSAPLIPKLLGSWLSLPVPKFLSGQAVTQIGLQY